MPTTSVEIKGEGEPFAMVVAHMTIGSNKVTHVEAMDNPDIPAILLDGHVTAQEILERLKP